MSQSSQDLEGGEDAIDPREADWADDVRRRRKRFAQRMDEAPAFPCPGCGWSDYFQHRTWYESSLKLIHGSVNRGVWKIGDAFVLKDEEDPQMVPGRCNEDMTNSLLRENTSIPVRGPGFAWTSGNRRYTLLPWVPGENMVQAYFHNKIDGTMKTDIYHQVVRCLQEVRQKLQSDRIVTADGGRCGRGYSLGIRGGLFPESREALLDYLKTKRIPNPACSTEELDAFRNRCPTFEPIVFSHGDLDVTNITVSEGRLSAIVDWEHAGFFPAWWEYCRMNDSLREIAGDYIGRYDDAAKWMQELSHYYPWGHQGVPLEE